MRRKGHPSFPSAMTCCFFSSLKTLLMPKEPIRAPLGVNVPGFPMAGFQLTLHGRIWVTPEAPADTKTPGHFTVDQVLTVDRSMAERATQIVLGYRLRSLVMA